MANGTDTEEFVVLSRVRTGLKREFQFALKAQAEICGSLGRTRGSKNRNGLIETPSNSNKRRKTCTNKKNDVKKDQRSRQEMEQLDNEDVKDREVSDMEVAGDPISEEEAKSDVVDFTSDDEPKSMVGESEEGVVPKIEEVVHNVEEKAKSDSVQTVVDGECKISVGEEKGRTLLDEAPIAIFEEELKNGSVEPSVAVETKAQVGRQLDDKMESKSETVMTICEDDVKSDVVETVSDDEHKNSPVEMRELSCKTESVQVKNNSTVKQVDQLSITEKEKSFVNCTDPVTVEENVATTPLRINVEGKVDTSLEKSMRRFTRSALKPKLETVVEIFSDDGHKNCPSEMFESSCKTESVQLHDNAMANQVGQLSKTETEKSFLNNRNPSVVEENVAATPVQVKVECKVEDSSLEKSMRRFTRSALKPKLETAVNAKGEAEETCFSPAGNDLDGSGDSDFNQSYFSPPQRSTSGKTRKKFPSKLKDLLSTGILEGLSVTYIRGSRVRRIGEVGLKGVVSGSGILCYCNSCKGNEVVTPSVFELHAGSSNKRPPEYIYLANGNTLRDVMNICSSSPLDTLGIALQTITGLSEIMKSNFCLNCRGSIPTICNQSAVLCYSCKGLKEIEPWSIQTSSTCTRTPSMHVVPKSSPSDSALKCSTSRGKTQGKLTRKDLRLHKLVFEEDVLPDGTEVAYYARGQKLLVGYKKGFGIFCTCCESEVSPSQFEAHAGWASRRKPYLHIYTSNGVSLHELSVSLSRGRKLTANDKDDLCSICFDGGNLLCCDGCPRAFHVDCVPLAIVPNGMWYCKYCQSSFQREKYVEHNADAVAAGRIAGVDPFEQINQRCIRIVKNVEVDQGGCALCRSHDFSISFGPRTVLICDQCEREYHVGCLKDHNMQVLEELPEGNWFCCEDCNQIYTALSNLVVQGDEKLPDPLLDMIRKKTEGIFLESSVCLDVRWRLLNWKLCSSDETRQLLSKAVAIFHERFSPIVDSASGHDFIPSMLYGNNIKGQDFGGMYCAILTVNQSVVSAGVFRIFGREVAELPLVATNADCQGQGYFQSLFSCIEKLLGSLDVKHLVLPAAAEAESIWTNKFGFGKLSHDEINEYRKHYQMVIFQGTSVLSKPVPAC